MPYVTSVERVGIRKGIVIGEEKGKADIVLRILKRRFGALDEATESQIRLLSVPQIEALSDALFDLTSPDDLQSWLLANLPQISPESTVTGDTANGSLPMED